MIAGDQPRRSRSNPVDTQRLRRRFHDRRVVSQIEVIVAAKRQEPATVPQCPDSGHSDGLAEISPWTISLLVSQSGRREFIEGTHTQVPRACVQVRMEATEPEWKR